ncbi:MADS-box protein 04g005320-like [Nicotiana tabacum]|uniref:MADS-box protein 04g005320-like n=1 Tax=Nicotiana tabacum TaxID=4097 RepID=A0AC58TG03_TOBAC
MAATSVMVTVEMLKNGFVPGKGLGASLQGSTQKLLGSREPVYYMLDPPPEGSQPSTDSQNTYQEYLKLKTRVGCYNNLKGEHILGEDLGQLNTKDLEQLERQVDSSLRQIRSTRTQQMIEELTELQQKEESLTEMNKSLRMKLEELGVALQTSWQYGEQSLQYREQQPGGFFHPVDCNNTMPLRLQVQYCEPEDAEPSTQHATEVVPGYQFDIGGT